MFLKFAILAVAAVSVLPGWSAAQTAAAPRRPLVVATIFPIYDWTRQIAGDRVGAIDLVLLQDGGTDFHSYQPTVRDLERIARCDVFVQVGGESDAWVSGALAQGGNPRRRVVNLIRELGTRAKTEQALEGMQTKPSAEAPEVDEHVWLSLRNAACLVGPIAEALAQADPAGAAAYRDHAAAYRRQLERLDADFRTMVASHARRNILFGDRFPFRYLADDYGLVCHAAFAGCSAESEASFKTIVFLAQKVDALGLPAILTLERPGHRIAETIRDATKTRRQKILRMDSLQSVGRAAVPRTTYLSAMQRNLATLAEALGE